jgi:hypothetical protein
MSYRHYAVCQYGVSFKQFLIRSTQSLFICFYLAKTTANLKRKYKLAVQDFLFADEFVDRKGEVKSESACKSSLAFRLLLLPQTK